ncbi:MAG: hypothetical protein SF066_03810 [Thermoanaerobaculia bacterium]|nr:hypothetical protein [Thermoanaerobaculia bacterium]
MIDDSVPWKELLHRKARAIAKRRQQRRWSSTSFALLEQDVMLAGYAVRKLLEAHKISDELANTAIAATAFPFKGTRRHFVKTGDLPDYMNWHRIDEFYDLEEPIRVQVALVDFCNQLVHSWIFLFARAEDGGMDGYFVASDRTRAQRVLYFDLAQTASVLHAVASDYIVFSCTRRDPETGQWRFVVRSKYARHESRPLDLQSHRER